MGVPPPASGDRQMWVRGPTARQAPAAAPAPPAAPAADRPAPVPPAAAVPQTAAIPRTAVVPEGTAAPHTTAAPQAAPAPQTAAAVPHTAVARQAVPAGYAPGGYPAPAAPGPHVPQPASARPVPDDWALPAEPVEWADRGDQGRHVSWVSAHGGAGASTLAREFGGTDLGRRWPDPARGEPGRVLLVARTHAAGMRAASRALDALRTEDHPPGVDLVALVLVADAPGRLPITLGRRVRVLRSATRVHRLPWVPAWRIGKKATKAPRAVRALSDLVEGRRR
ncbi:DUF6668 family protein [Streptomyces sp. NPDC101249]|uniref:DUF6668 family protein n=1 Tax=Streptomyces sp. NPDC101249 TaxID=3366140 RepID=UPI003803C880